MSGKFLWLACLLTTGLAAQNKPTELDKSPMDMSYLPMNYPLLKMSGKAKNQPLARVVYGRPAKNGREIFGGIIKYNEMWRLGANEATELELFVPARVGGKSLPKGRYTLYCLPAENKWTIIVNKDNYSWGNFSYDNKKDFCRIEIPVEKNPEPNDIFTIYFEENNGKTQLVFCWDTVKANLPIAIANK